MPEEKKRGSNGGNARKEKLSKERRSEIAAKAAKKRWGKKKEGATITATVEENIVAVNLASDDSYTSNPTFEAPKEFHCPSCIGGNPLEQGLHIAGTIEHPFTPVPAQIVDSPPVFVEPAPAPLQKPVKRQPRPMPKEFKTASSYAERRLPLAIKEKSEHVGAVAKLDAEINDLVRVIKALGGTVDAQAQQPMYQQQTYYPSTPQMPYQAAQGQLPVDPGIDPALFQANMGPVPGMPKVPIIPNTALGGATDLDYVPRDEDEHNKLPNMGGGWV